jgi:poly(3-hydroxybutyrate) depolymerase
MNNMKILRQLILPLFLINIFSAGIIHAQTVDEIFNKYIKSYHTYASVTLPYYLFIPDAYDSQLQYPLVLCLHGSGERGDNPSAVKLNSMAIVWARDSNQTRWPCFILVPQCPASQWWTITNIEQNVNDFLDSLLNEFSIDTNRLYITGLSMGGYGTWDMIARYPTRFAAAVPMSGGGDSSQASLIKHIPIWNFHGAQDGTVPVTASRKMITALENAGDTIVYTNCHNGDCTGLPDNVIAEKIQNGAKHLYTEYQYGSHAIWDEAYNYVFLLPWVFSQSKPNTSTDLVEEYLSSLPKKPVLFQNYPNPFNLNTTIRFELPPVRTRYIASLRVYDLLGREVATLANGPISANTYQVQWNAEGLSSGIYIYILTARNFTETKKLLLLK